jgi:outer membrane lipoprotein-sorting protein
VKRHAAFIVLRQAGAFRAGARTRKGAQAMLRKTLMGIALLALLAPIASAQTVDELIVKNIQAKGGLEKIKAMQTMRLTGKMVMAQGMEIPMSMVQKRPKSFRMEYSFQGMTMVQAYDGKTCWALNPMTGKKDPEAQGAEETKQAEEQADLDGPLMDYKEKGNTVELAGKEQVEGADAYKLKVTLKNGDIRNIYLDAETYLEIKVEAKRTVRGTEVEGESYMSDYKEVEGMMMPFAVESGVKGSPQRQKIVIEKVELNPMLPDSLFSMPVVAASDSTKAGAAANDSTKTHAAAAPDTSKGASAGAKSATPARPGAKKSSTGTKKK